MSTAPLSNVDIIAGKIAALDKALADNLPNYAELLHVIHKNLSEDEALSHLLTEEQIAVICKGLYKKTQTVIVEGASKGNSVGNKKKLSGLTLDDL